MRKKLALLNCLWLLTTFFGCVEKSNVSQNVNTSSSSQPIASPQPMFSAPTYASCGLGLAQADWERLHGSGRPDNASSPMFFEYENGKFQVQFSEIRSGNVEYIERVWGDRNAVPLEDARRDSKNFIPADAKFVRTYTSRSESTIDLYTSESLKARFSASDFIGGKPGDFIILYRNQTGRTTTFIISVGNNP
jgi:hypothetical protein